MPIYIYMPKFKTKKRNKKIHKMFNMKFKEKKPQTLFT